MALCNLDILVALFRKCHTNYDKTANKIIFDRWAKRTLKLRARACSPSAPVLHPKVRWRSRFNLDATYRVVVEAPIEKSLEWTRLRRNV